MPFSRARRAFRSRSPRFRRRSGLRQSNDLRRWEFCNFDVVRAQTSVPGTIQTNVTSMGQIIDHLADSGTVPGVLQSYQIRALEISGIVFSLNSFLNQSPTAAVSAHTLLYYALYVDRLASNGAPSSQPSFAVTTPPVAAATVSSVGETTFPTRVLWRETRVFPSGASDVGLPHPQTYYAGSRSLRLRLRLPDDMGLFWHIGLLSPGGSAAQNWTTSFSGTLYWRTAFK